MVHLCRLRAKAPPLFTRSHCRDAAEESLSHAARLIIRSMLLAGLAGNSQSGATRAYAEMPHRSGRKSSEVSQASPGFLGPLPSPEDPGGNLPSCPTGRGAQPSASLSDWATAPPLNAAKTTLPATSGWGPAVPEGGSPPSPAGWTVCAAGTQTVRGRDSDGACPGLRRCAAGTQTVRGWDSDGARPCPLLLEPQSVLWVASGRSNERARSSEHTGLPRHALTPNTLKVGT